MENTTFTPEMTKLLADLGEGIKNTDVYKKYAEAVEVYTRSEGLNQMVFEYNTHQMAITEEYKKPERDQGVIDAISKRIEELYTKIVDHEDYKAFLAAQEEYQTYMQSLYAELDYYITGKKACSHDCSTCGGCH